MKWARLAATMVLTALLAACGAPPEPETAKPASQGPGETVFDDMVGTMDKARTVEETAAQRQRELQQTLEQAEGK